MEANTECRVKKGQMKDEIFIVEGPIADICGSGSLADLACIHGNWAARNAIEHEGYTVNDRPFYYGKIGSLGFIFAEKDLDVTPARAAL